MKKATFSRLRHALKVGAAICFTLPLFLLIPTPSFAFSRNPTLKNIPANTALSLGKYTGGSLQGCYRVSSEGTYGGFGIVGYSRFVYDRLHNQMLMWGGGHATTPRTDVDVLDLNQASLKWKSAYPSTQISDMRISNYDLKTGSWISTGHPAAVHSYDQLVFAENTGELIYLQNRGSPTSPCLNEHELRVQTYITRGPIWHYNPTAKIWTPAEVTAGGEWSTFSYVAAEYDPVSGKVIVVGNDGMSVYDPITRVTQRAVRAFPGLSLSYAQNLIYFPPTDKMYYVMNNGTVYELTLNRRDFTKSTLVIMTGIAGTLPPRPLPPADWGETGWAYDSVNHIIGGGVLKGVFYAFDPIGKVWSSSKMHKSPENFPYAIGSLNASHALDYDPVDNVFIFITGGENPSATYEKYVWAYRYK